ncbi:MAG: tetratricopeptide repeat protein [Gammaproteobacteria bacterium]|nr:tetratricopeptide repeat protein [Gammaproteobacteria bacterium]
MESARAAQARADLEAAASYLERALRIEPRDTKARLALARIRLQQGDTVQAENLAHMAMETQPQNADVQLAGWELIVEARRRRGDWQAALAAENEAAKYRAGYRQ